MARDGEYLYYLTSEGKPAKRLPNEVEGADTGCSIATCVSIVGAIALTIRVHSFSRKLQLRQSVPYEEV